MKNTIKYISLSLLLCVVNSCNSDDGGNGSTDPTTFDLIFPENNKECTEGTNVSERQSEVKFQWDTSDGASHYELYVLNLEDQTLQTLSASTNEKSVVLDRNIAYSWFVITHYASGGNLQSDTWNFYLAGIPVEFHAPFPANNVSPTIGETVEAGNSKVMLKWEGSDLDDDIVSYSVEFGIDKNALSTIAELELEEFEVEVMSNTAYFWRIVTKDSMNNTSQSMIYEFKVK